MIEMLYMKDAEANYIQRFSAKVIKKTPQYVILDKTAFYPTGGGQPCDTGKLIYHDGECRVSEVLKKGNEIRHYVDKEIDANEVDGIIDWDRRYKHMRMHTSQHIISAVVYDMYGAKTVSNQIHAEYSRIDFHPLSIDDEGIKKIEDSVNEIIKKNLNVEIKHASRNELFERKRVMRVDLSLLPTNIKILRVVEIGEYDICPCAGTHVMSTDEIGHVSIIGKESKGKNRVRIKYIIGDVIDKN